jgi:hypothetical protein
MSERPAGVEADQTATTKSPSAAIETFAFARPATDSVIGDVSSPNVTAPGATIAATTAAITIIRTALRMAITFSV